MIHTDTINPGWFEDINDGIYIAYTQIYIMKILIKIRKNNDNEYKNTYDMSRQKHIKALLHLYVSVGYLEYWIKNISITTNKLTNKQSISLYKSKISNTNINSMNDLIKIYKNFDDIKTDECENNIIEWCTKNDALFILQDYDSSKYIHDYDKATKIEEMFEIINKYLGSYVNNFIKYYSIYEKIKNYSIFRYVLLYINEKFSD